ncbi:MAG: hypothetical protein WC659_06935 [Patescibacteria group bacterium]
MKEKKIRVVRIKINHPYMGIPREVAFKEINFNLNDIENLKAIALEEVFSETGYNKEDFKVEVLHET